MPDYQSPYDHQFEKLAMMKEGRDRDELFGELLREAEDVLQPLMNFLKRAEETEELCVLVDLLGKISEKEAIPLLIDFLNSEVSEIRRSSALALGWCQAVQALERLDEVEEFDHDEKVQYEARQAIEEILRTFPRQRETLKYHKALDSDMDPEIAGEHDTVPTDKPDPEQKIKLMAALPRLLAVRYDVLPLHFSHGDKLHVAVRADADRNLISRLSDLTGKHIELHSWTPSDIQIGIDEFYTLGDDDFCTFNDQLTQFAQDEVREILLSTVRDDEPACPLDEANDAVEAIQSLFTACCSMKISELTIKYKATAMSIAAERNGEERLEISPPEKKLHQRFVDGLRSLAGISHTDGPVSEQSGEIRLAFCNPPVLAAIHSHRDMNSETLKVEFSREK